MDGQLRGTRTFRKGISDAEANAILKRIKANNPDERGVLASWDGDYWKIIERKQYTDVTGPGWYGRLAGLQANTGIRVYAIYFPGGV